MNTAEYISSGIIESYVLGLANAEERAEFEQMCEKYPEVREVRIAFELLLEKQAFEHALPVSTAVKNSVLYQVRETSAGVTEARSPVVRMGWLKYAAALLFFMLLGSLYWNLRLQTSTDELRKKLDSSNSELAQIKKDAQVMQDNPAVKMARLDGQAISPNSMATVYWDTTSKDVYLMVNNLPKPPTNEQYQLWALINGKPMDMGMLEITSKPLQLYRMKNVQSAQAFAITLEKKGGNPTPTMEKMYVMGKL